MIKSLTIENYALIESLHIDFQKGLNIITGETGTGKSIILGALGLILGDRAKTDMIRQGAKRAMVEVSIEISDTNTKHIISQFIGEAITQDLMIIRRELYQTSRSRCYVNDSPVSLAQFAELGDILIDLHGQHEHQALFQIENHLNYLDNYSSNRKLTENVRLQYNLYISCLQELEDLTEREKQLRSKQELLEFQVKEIKNVNPQEGEDEKLESEERMMRHAEKLHETVSMLENLLYEGENSAVEQLSAASQLLNQHIPIDEHFLQWTEECNSARISIQELFVSIQDFVSKIEFNPEHLEEIRNRLGNLIHLKKKYGGTLDEVLTFYQNASSELKQIESLDQIIQNKQKDLSEAQAKLSESCIQLSKDRQEIAGKLSKAIIEILMELGLSHGEMKIQVKNREKPNGPVYFKDTHYAASEKGMDEVEFLISLNPGESPKPLRYVASGGEISRIMLAIKTILAESDNIPILVFDEIDTGISGRIARIVGQNLKKISNKHQVICITHLPQIASMGHVQYSVEKEITKGRTRTTIRQLSEEERVAEIAKLMGGETITETNLQSAKELMQ